MYTNSVLLFLYAATYTASIEVNSLRIWDLRAWAVAEEAKSFAQVPGRILRARLVSAGRKNSGPS